jgi:hypothetical protein
VRIPTDKDPAPNAPENNVILYDDVYGVITEADLIKEAAEFFKMYDEEEKWKVGGAQ